jgi:hypothetical protein
MSSGLSSQWLSFLSPWEQSIKSRKPKTKQTRKQRMRAPYLAESAALGAQTARKSLWALSPVRTRAGTAALSRNRKGASTIMPDTLVQLVVVAIVVVIAVLLFVKIWNFFFGVDTINEDVSGLAKMMEAMAKDEKSFEQRPYLLQIEDNFVTGHEASVGNLVQCGTQACICKAAKENDNNKKCFTIQAPDGAKIALRTDYTGFPRGGTLPLHGSAPRTANTESDHALADDETFDDTPYARTQYRTFILHRFLLRYTDANKDDPKDADVAKAIIPLIIEKTVSGNTIYFTALPDTQYARGRAYYGYVCGTKEENECSGLTGHTSYKENVYCAPDIFSKEETCTKTPMPACKYGKFVTQPCRCAGVTAMDGVMTYGVCLMPVPPSTQSPALISKYACNTVKSCEDYCHLLDGEDDCSTAERTICNFNTCGLQLPCKTDTSSAEGYCIAK